MNAQDELGLHWAHMSEGTFSSVAVHLLWVLTEAHQMSTHNMCFHKEINKKVQFFVEKRDTLSLAMCRIRFHCLT